MECRRVGGTEGELEVIHRGFARANRLGVQSMELDLFIAAMTVTFERGFILSMSVRSWETTPRLTSELVCRA